MVKILLNMNGGVLLCQEKKINKIKTITEITKIITTITTTITTTIKTITIDSFTFRIKKDISLFHSQNIARAIPMLLTDLIMIYLFILFIN